MIKLLEPSNAIPDLVQYWGLAVTTVLAPLLITLQFRIDILLAQPWILIPDNQLFAV